MFRVADCPNNYSQNRIGSLDIRMLAGSEAVHPDMMMWHQDEKPENVALQFIHALLSVPQVSVKLNEMSNTVLYNSQYLKVQSMAHKEIVINSNKQERIIVDFMKSVRGISYIYNCLGDLISETPINFEAGIQSFTVPVSGVLSIEYD